MKSTHCDLCQPFQKQRGSTSTSRLAYYEALERSSPAATWATVPAATSEQIIDHGMWTRGSIEVLLINQQLPSCSHGTANQHAHKAREALAAARELGMTLICT